jgi:putative transposase
MKENQAAFPVKAMCRMLGLSTSGYYTWLTRPPSKRARSNEVLLRQIRGIHRFSRQTYGRPRIHAELRDDGVLVNHKRVARLMSRNGIVGATRRRKWRTTKRDRNARPAPDLIERDFTATGPNQLWVADITYVPTSAGFLFLAVVVDA